MPRPSRTAAFLRMLATALLLGLIGTAANAATVLTANKKLDGGRADFGDGLHSFGSPSGHGVITYAHEFPSGLTVTGRVRGTLYWDALFSAGCARLTIRFQDRERVDLETRRLERCGPGGNANDSPNQRAVDESYSNPRLYHIIISANEVLDGRVLSGASVSIAAPLSRTYAFRINNGNTDLGSGFHALGGPTGDATVRFTRDDGQLTSDVSGTLYWDSAFASGCARALVQVRAQWASSILDTATRDVCGPGGDANKRGNFGAITNTFTSAYVYTTDITVGSLANGVLVGAVTRVFGFNGEVGDFELDTPEVSTDVHARVRYGITWTLPDPLNWHDLESLHLRILDDDGTILWLLWDEATNTFSVLNEATGRFGRAAAPGRPLRLQTPHATVYLAESSVGAVNGVLGNGPASPSVLITLTLGFKPSAAGRTYRVQLAATDDFGREDAFVDAGTLTVNW